MKKLLAMAAVGLLACAPPGISQARRLPQIKHLSAEIDRGVRDGSLTRTEARDLREKLIALEADDARDIGYRVKQPKIRGVTPAPTDPKAFDLDRRFAAMEADIRVQRANNVRARHRHHGGHPKAPAKTQPAAS